MHKVKTIAKWLGCTAMLLVAPAACGQTLLWNNPTTGTFQTPNNWTPQTLPGPASTVVFSATDTVIRTVNFNGSITTSGFGMVRGAYAFNVGDINGPAYTYTISNTNGFVLGNTNGLTPEFSLNRGTIVLGSNNSGMATAVGSQALMRIEGGANFIATGWNDVGVQGRAVVEVLGNYQTGSFSSIGYQSTANGYIRVFGQMVSGPGMAIGNMGRGTISFGGSTPSDLGLGTVLGQEASGIGTIYVGRFLSDIGVLGSFTSGNVNTHGLTIGLLGQGQFNVEAFSLTGTATSTVNNQGAVNIAASNGSLGSLNIQADPNCTSIWNQSAGLIYVGGTASGAGGTGSINVGTNGQLKVTGTGNGIVARAGHGTVTLNGGLIDTVNLSAVPVLNSGTLTINGGTLLGNDGTPFDVNFNVAGTGALAVNLVNGASFSPRNLIVGQTTATNRFNVLSGAVVNSRGSVLIGNGSSTMTSAVASVDGAGSRWNTPLGTTIVVGGAFQGDGSGTLNIQNGGVFDTGGSGVSLGVSNGNANTGIINVAGNGSVLNMGSGILFIGNSTVSTGVLNITGGGTVHSTGTGTGTAGNAFVGGYAGTGIVNVSGGTWNLTDTTLYIGGAYLGAGGGPGGSGTVRVETGGIINVTGASSQIYHYSGHGALVLDGGTVNTPNLYMPDLQFNNNTFLRGTLNIQGGVFDNTGKSFFASSSTGTLSIHLLNGASFTPHNIFVGQAGGSNFVTVQNGSLLTTLNGNSIGTQGSTTASAVVTITGVGSVMNSGKNIDGDSIFVGINGSGGTLRVLDSASVFTNNGHVRMGVGGASTAIVQVDRSTLNAGTGRITVGDASGSLAQLTITNTSIVQSANGYLGVNAGASGLVHLDGALGQAGNWFLSDTLALGGNAVSPGGTGTLNLNSSSMIFTDKLVLWPGGTFNINGGTLQLTNLMPQGGKVQFNAGNVSFSLNWNADYPQLSAVLGTNPMISTGQRLSVAGTTQLYSDLTVDGGIFTTGVLAGGSLLHLNSGYFHLTNSHLVIGTGGTLGATVNVPVNLQIGVLNSNNNVQINNEGRLFLSGGTLYTVQGSTGITNHGQIQMLHPLSQISGGPITNYGLIVGSGQISASLNNVSTGTVRASAGERLVLAGASNSNAGNIVLAGGTVEFLGQLTNAATGAITGRGTLVTNSATPGDLGLVNQGVLLFSSGNTDIYGDLQNNAGGRIVTSGAGITTFYDDVVHNGVEIRTNAGSRTVFFGNQSGAGNFTGTGIVEYNGDYRPGNSAANVQYAGSVQFNSTAGLYIELGGTLPGIQYDRLTILGNVELSGLLDLNLINGFLPRPNDSFMIIDNQGAAALNGFFTGLSEGDQFPSNGTLFRITYIGGDGNDLVLTAVPEPATWAMMGIFSAAAGAYAYLRKRRHYMISQSDLVQDRD